MTLLSVLLLANSAAGQIAPGSALDLDGVSGHAAITLSSLPASNYTISAWVYLRSGGAVGNPRVAILSSAVCGSTAEFLIRGDGPGEPQYLQLARCFQHEGAISDRPVPTNTWVQVSVSVKNTGSSNAVSFFINGTPAGTSLLENSNDLSLGTNLALGYNDGSARKFDGYLDEVQIWQDNVPPLTGHVLNGAETNLLAYFRFDEGNGTTSGDSASAVGAGSATLQGGAGWTVLAAPPFPPGSPAPGADWVSHGPTVIEDRAGKGISSGAWGIEPDFPINGNIYAAAPHPVDDNILYVGAVNGGIWKTINAMDPSPTWIPLTDHQPSPSISCLEYDPTDPTHQTLVAGFGNYSSSGRSGPLLGLLRTTDGGVNWQRITPPSLSNAPIIAVAARGNILMAASSHSYPTPNAGLHRSTDGGLTFANLAGAAGGLPAGDVDAMVGVPGNPSRFYAASRGAGVFRSDDTGATWVKVANGIVDVATGCGILTERVGLAVHSRNGSEVVYALVLNRWSYRPYVYYSTNSGGAWFNLGQPTQGDDELSANFIHFSVGADPQDPTVAYVGGTGISLWRVNRSSTNLFTSIVGYNTNPGRSVHADSHVLKFNASGDLVEVDDGGVYRLPRLAATHGQNGVTPDSSDGWRSMIGNLALTEFYGIAYDPRGQVLIGGNHDNGMVEQHSSGSGMWRLVSGGDGGPCVVDTRSTPGRTIRLFGRDALEYRGLIKKVYTNDGQLVSSSLPTLRVLGEGAFPRWYYAMEVNAVDGRRMLFGLVNGAFESTDHGDTLRRIGNNRFIAGVFTRMVYGGERNGIPNPDLIWATGSDDRSGIQSVKLRTNGTDGLRTVWTNALEFEAIVAKPTDWHRAYACTAREVFETTDAGVSWTTITANLNQGPRLRTLEYLPLPSGDVLAAGTDDGVYVMPLAAGQRRWTRLGANLPRAIAYSLRYDPSNQVLALGTHGRGAWTYSMAGWPQNSGAGMAMATSPEAGTVGVLATVLPALRSNYTIGAWIHLRSGGQTANPRVAILSSLSCGGSVELLLRSATTNAADPQFLELARCGSFDGQLSERPVPLNQWVHVAVTVGPALGDGGAASNLVSYYVNGLPAGSHFSVGRDLSLDTSVVLALNNGSSRVFNGWLDRVSIWATAIPPGEIPHTMTRQPGGYFLSGALALNLDFDEGTGSSVAGFGSGTILGAVNWVPSAAPQTVAQLATRPAQNVTATSATVAGTFAANGPLAGTTLRIEYGPTSAYGATVEVPVTPRETVNLDGLNDFISTAQEFDNPQEFSIGLWFRTTSRTGGRLLGFGSSRTEASALLDRHLYLGADGLLRFGVYNTAPNVITGGTACNDGRWRHVMATFSPTNGMRLYLDGLPVASKTNVGPVFNYTGYWRIGWDEMPDWPGASDRSYFAGSIAEVQIWDTVLSSEAIAASYGRALTGREPGLNTYYLLDEGGFGNTIVTEVAAAGGQNLGTLHGDPVWTPTVDLPTGFSHTLQNLEPATTYHYRVVAENGAGTRYSADRIFTTAAPALSGAISGSDFLLTWPNPSTGFLLELSGPSADWTIVPPPYISNGNSFQTNLLLRGDVEFFRLRRP